MHTSNKGRNMPGEADGYTMPVRPAPGGYGASAADIKRGYSQPAHPKIDTEESNSPWPVPGQRSYPRGRNR